MPTQLVHAALVITNQHLDRSKVIGRVAVYGLEYKPNTYDPETIMADSVDPFPLLTQGIDQTRKAMESYLDFFQKTMKAPPCLCQSESKNENLHGAEYCRCVSVCAGSKQSQGFAKLLAGSV
jgi:hypothetical protein